MKRLLAPLAVAIGIAVAGCGSSGQPSASAQCSKLKTSSDAWAQTFVNGMPNQTAQSTARLALASYKTAATSHGLNCSS